MRYLYTRSPLVTDDIVFNCKRVLKEDKLVIERWKDIVIDGYTTDYEISTLGRVRCASTKKLRKVAKKKITKGRKIYVCVSFRVQRKRRTLSIHRLVAMAFIPIPKKYRELGLTFKDLEVNHIDARTWHNVITNLEWVTPEDNRKHAVKNKLITPPKGEEHWLTDLTDETVRSICEMFQAGKYPSEVSRLTGISTRILVHIRAGETWRHISKDYHFPKKPGEHSKPNTVSDETIHRVCQLLEDRAKGKNNFTEQIIANECGIGRQYVNLLLHKKCRRSIVTQYNF